MPWTEVLFFKEPSGRAPVLRWLETIKQVDRRAFSKCVVAIRRLAREGHVLRRPTAGYLRDGLYELRIRQGRVNYRILYFFHERKAAVLVHGVTKIKAIRPEDVRRAIERKRVFEADPEAHAHESPPY
jgi:hypothetical protein